MAGTWLTELLRQGNSFRTRSAKATRRTFTHSLTAIQQMSDRTQNKSVTISDRRKNVIGFCTVLGVPACSAMAAPANEWPRLGTWYSIDVPFRRECAGLSRYWYRDFVTLVSGIQKLGTCSNSAHQRCGLHNAVRCFWHMGSNLQMPQCHSPGRHWVKQLKYVPCWLMLLDKQNSLLGFKFTNTNEHELAGK